MWPRLGRPATRAPGSHFSRRRRRYRRPKWLVTYLITWPALRGGRADDRMTGAK